MSILGDVAGPLIKSVAPTLATALGGPLAGMAVGFVAKKLLGKDNASADEIAKTIAAMKNPEDLAKLKEIDAEFKLRMEQLGVDVFALEVEDRVSAREFGSQSVIGAVFQVVVGTLIVGGFLWSLYRVLTGQMELTDPNMAMTVGTMLGYISAKADQVIAFLFGSSQGSKSKTDQLSAALNNLVRK